MLIKIMERVLTIIAIILFIIALGNKIFEGVKNDIIKNTIQNAKVDTIIDNQIIMNFENELYSYTIGK